MKAQHALSVLYVAFMAYAIFCLPGSFRTAFAPERVHAVIALHDTENRVFLSLFLLIGVLQIAQIALLLPAEAVQKRLSTRLFCALGFFFGLYVSGPYMALRTRAPKLSRAALGSRAQRVAESRVFGCVVLAAAIATYAFAVRADFTAELASFMALLKTDRLVAAVAFDLALSCVFALDAVVEDMRRRGWAFEGKEGRSSAALAVAICAVPGAGIAAYLAARPRLPELVAKEA